MRSTSMSLALAVALAAGGSLAGNAAAPETQSAPARSFTLSADPADRVLVAVYSGTLLLYRPSFTLFADGRFLAEKLGHGNAVLESVETYLPPEEVESLLRELIDRGFLDTTQKSIEERIAAKGPPPLMSDAGNVIVSMHLASYTKDGQAVGPITHRIATEAPKIMSMSHPEIPELVGFVRITERFVELERRAVKERDSEKAP